MKRRFLVIFSLIALCFNVVRAEVPSEARQSIEEARLLIRNFHHEDGRRILWEIFLNGERLNATRLELAEAADMLVSFGGTKNNKEYLYLLTWAAEAEYPPAMEGLASSILRDYNDAKSTVELQMELSEYPKIFTEEDAVALLRAAAGQGDPNAIRELGAFYKTGKHGFLADPYRAEELFTEALQRRIEIGRAGNHHELILAAKAINAREGSVKKADGLIAESIEIGSRQPGGMDASAAINLAQYYRYSYKGDEGRAIANEYRWRIHSLRRESERYRKSHLSNLGEFFAGKKSFLRDEYEVPIDIVAAHAIFNYLGTQGWSDFVEAERKVAAKNMTDAEMKEALKLARTCAENSFSSCLNAIDAHYRRTSG